VLARLRTKLFDGENGGAEFWEGKKQRLLTWMGAGECFLGESRQKVRETWFPERSQ
jgi:hypothetical protein